MMSEASFASLGPTLLARKGGAKPAMRPQLTPLPDDMSEMAALAEEQLEDLGWNDMGAEREADGISELKAPLLSAKPNAARDAQSDNGGANIVPIDARSARPNPANEDTLPEIGPETETETGPETGPQEGPVIRTEQKRLARDFMSGAVQVSAEKQTIKPTKPRAKSSQKSGKRAAFTLRLDTDRHLKLRLASTMQGVSAQSLVTDALDALLDGIEELDTLVERMKRD